MFEKFVYTIELSIRLDFDCFFNRFLLLAQELLLRLLILLESRLLIFRSNRHEIPFIIDLVDGIQRPLKAFMSFDVLYQGVNLFESC